ncbi:MAG: hypothetical protein K8R90_11825 [Candidatus Cloacimonetes bacterium]|nr:hypothetical protein [Candidatus Cloacimonadota bacterium]
MAEDNHILTAIPKVQRIRIASRRESPQPRHNGEQQRRDDHEQQDGQPRQEPAAEATPQWWHYQIELGRLLMEQKNLELSLFTSLQEEDAVPDLPSERKERRSRDNHLLRIKGRIAELEQKIANLDWAETHRTASPEKLELDRQMQGLTELRELYRQYYSNTEQETEMIGKGDLPTLHQLMNTKKDLLERAHVLQEMLDIELFRGRSEEDAERAKANRILSDIHSVMNRILDRENQNSVELRNQKEEVKAELGKRNAGAKAISRYANALRQSRFVDTTK